MVFRSLLFQVQFSLIVRNSLANLIGELIDLYQFISFIKGSSEQEVVQFMEKYTDFNFTVREGVNFFIPSRRTI